VLGQAPHDFSNLMAVGACLTDNDLDALDGRNGKL
jgi:hypothetical protein